MPLQEDVIHRPPPDAMAANALFNLLQENESLRQGIRACKGQTENLLIRLGLHQLDHGPILVSYMDPRWDAVLKLVEDGALALSVGVFARDNMSAIEVSVGRRVVPFNKDDLPAQTSGSPANLAQSTL